MKWSKDQVSIIENAFREFIDNCGHTLQEIRESYSGTPKLNVMYAIWRHVQYDLTADDSHPAFTEHGRVRKVSYCEDFILYPKGCNDTHFDTVLKRVGKSIGLID